MALDCGWVAWREIRKHAESRYAANPAAAGWRPGFLARALSVAALGAALAGQVAAAATNAPAPAVDYHGGVPPPPGEGEIVAEVFGRLPGVAGAEVMRFVSEYLPEQMDEFRRLATGHRDRASAYLLGLVREALELMDARRRNPPWFRSVMEERRLTREADALGEAVRGSQGAERQAHVAALRAVLEKAFEVRQELLRADVVRLQSEIDRLRLLVEKRQRNREAVLGRRLAELAGEKDALVW